MKLTEREADKVHSALPSSGVLQQLIDADVEMLRAMLAGRVH